MSCPLPACSLEGGTFSSMGSFFSLDEEVEVGESCHPGKERRRRADLPAQQGKAISRFWALGTGLRVTTCRGPQPSLEVSRGSAPRVGVLVPAAGFADGEALLGEAQGAAGAS